MVLWMNQTTVPVLKQRPAIVGSLHGDARTAGKMLFTEILGYERGLDPILELLEQVYAVEKSNKLVAGLADFPSSLRRKDLSVEHLISGFHTIVDKISSVNHDENVKGDLLVFRDIWHRTRKNVVVGTANKSYKVSRISAALCAI